MRMWTPYYILKRLFKKFIEPNQVEALRKNGMIIGKNLALLPGCFIDFSHCWHITIGDDVSIAPNVSIFAHDASMKMHLNYARIGKVVIGNRVFIGAGSIILPGVMIGSDVVVGAGSVVSRDIPDNSVASGNPARVIGKTDEYLTRKKAEMEFHPCFSEKYTIRGGVTPEMKAEMNAAMKDRIGYVI